MLDESTRTSSFEFGVQRLTVKAGEQVSKEACRGKTRLVNQLVTDRTSLAEESRFHPVIGCSAEIDLVIQIQAWRNENNPALIGEPGVGKIAIVEGLAQRIVQNDVPAPLMSKRVMQLGVGSLVATPIALEKLAELGYDPEMGARPLKRVIQ